MQEGQLSVPVTLESVQASLKSLRRWIIAIAVLLNIVVAVLVISLANQNQTFKRMKRLFNDLPPVLINQDTHTPTLPDVFVIEKKE